MFDDNHIDSIRAILESGQEEVPAHIWEGVSSGLDKAAARRNRILWLRRSVAGVAAAAAVVVGLLIGHDGTEQNLVPEVSGDMIAVIETPSQETAAPREILLADIPASSPLQTVRPATKDIPAAAAMSGISSESAKEIPAEKAEADTISEPTENTPEPAVSGTSSEETSWEEDEKEIKSRKLKTSLVVSGIAGTNNPQGKKGTGPLRSPGIYKAPTKTTIEQSGSQATYGIPLSFGAGVKLRFTDRWSLGMGVNYTLLTSRFSGKYTKVTDGVASLPISSEVKNQQHYIGIPVNVYYNIVSRDFINFYAYAGGTVEKCVANRYQVQTTPIINHSESVKGVQLSANAGIGVEFLLGKYVGLYLDPSLRYYFRGSQPKSIRTAQPLMLGFEMGLRFNL